MSGSNRRRVSKWDHKDSEALSETFHERSSGRKTGEPLSPSRASRRHESRGKESIVPWDREGSGARMSPGLDDWGDRHHIRSPRNDWRRSYRSRSRSRTRSRSRSPIHNSRRDPPMNDNRSRGGSRSAVSGQQICRDFSAGRCRRGTHCQFLHPNVEPYDGGGRPLKNSSPDEWDNINNNNDDGSRHRRNRGGSRYSPEKGPVEDVYGSRERDPEPPRNRDPYQDRNRDRDWDPPPPNRGETPLCKFFAAGNCRNGKRCRFSHEVEGSRRSVDDDNRQGAPPPLDHKFDNEPPVWNGPTWDDVGLGDNKNETTEAATEMGLMNNSKNNTWDPSGDFDEPKTRDRDKWKSENGDMEISPNPQTLPNMSFPPATATAVQKNPTGETSYEKRYPFTPFPDLKVVVSDSNSSYPGLNPSFGDDVGINQKVVNESSPYPGLNPSFRDDVGVTQRVVNDSSSYPGLNPSYNGNEGNNPPPIMNPPPQPLPPPPAQQQQAVFQGDPRVNLQLPIEPFPLAPTDPPSAAVAANPINPNNPVRSEQLAQLSHLTASLAQLLESRQSTSAAAGVVASLNGAVKPQQYDPISDSVEPKSVHKEPHLQQQEEHNNDDNNKEPQSKEDENDENDGGEEDGKKTKDSKGTRAFKFALADFVKDLLKPAWKDGQVSKDVYKTIVKKVVDKVIETQGPQVPQTKEKIDQYLSYSKPKLEKLVQAYVGKYHKGKA